ncbi:uncharacterized protein LOC143921006 isoform X2 [Arctopsyche grandis]|uniref:uncharacterized protein LOC143921006 isoform X2 n=1 Tax=Arctopsyche grandis TaxID=121162 RepID=UPI00406D6EE0
MELYSYYRLDERSSEAVSGIWKGLHLSLLFIALIFSICCTVLFHILIAAFDVNCVLFPKIIVLQNTSAREAPDTMMELINGTYHPTDLPIDFIKSQWVDMTVCYNALYNPILSAIFGIVWMTFFLMCPKGGKSYSGLTRPWRIVLPSAVFTLVYSILCIIVTHHLTDGLLEFQEQFKNVAGIQDPKYQYEVNKIDSFVLVTIISSWLYTSSWALGFVVLVLRCVFIADFQLIKVSVQLLDKESESEANKVRVESSLKTTEPSISYYTPSTSREVLDSQSVMARAYIEPKKLNDNEDPAAFEDFDPAFEDGFNVLPQANSSRLIEASNHDIVAPKDAKQNNNQNAHWI